ncbi:MAG: c-type cytochrome [Rhodomicrobium sp.]|nr:c-type cytochrome [Rhodomicrobium sp.]
MARWNSGGRLWKAAFARRFLMVAAICWSVMSGYAVFAAPEGSRFNKDYFTNTPVTTHEGKTVPFYDALVEGKMVVINFMYLTCNDICPLTTSRMAEIRAKLGEAVGRDIFIYSITMDPENDTPELMKDYAEAFGVGNGWLFLTGKPEDIKRLRWRLGERSRSLLEHRNDLVLGNETTGEWSRTSVFADIDLSVRKILELDPAWMTQRQTVSSTAGGDSGYRLDKDTGQALFTKACSTCHSIGGGDLIGPDLKDVAKRRDRDWLTRFMMAPDKMRAEKDPLTMKLARKYGGVIMPNLGLEQNDIADLLDYIERRSRAADTSARNDAVADGGKAGTIPREGAQE